MAKARAEVVWFGLVWWAQRKVFVSMYESGLKDYFSTSWPPNQANTQPLPRCTALPIVCCRGFTSPGMPASDRMTFNERHPG